MVGLEEEEPGSRGSPLLGSSFMARVIRYGRYGGESKVRDAAGRTTIAQLPANTSPFRAISPTRFS